MSRRSGFEGPGYNRIKGLFPEFENQVLKAKKKAGRKIGPKIVKERKAALRAVRGKGLSKRRNQAIRYVVGRDGTLVVMDHAPMAVLQEVGGTIKAKDKLLRINRQKPGYEPKNDTFVTKKGFVFEKGKYRKGRKVQPKPKLIAVLKPEVVIEELPENAKFTKIAEKHLTEFRDLFQEYLFD